MTAREIRHWLDKRPFHPFRVVMNNGESYEVRHPELAFIAETGALYIFEPSKHEPAQVTGHQTICAIRNNSTVEPLEPKTA